MVVSFVPANFTPPAGLAGPGFRLEPLGPQHNLSDHAAWSSSIPHILATPGFIDWPPPNGMTSEANLADLEQHARDFADRTGFTYTVLEGSQVIGCVYIYPSKQDPALTVVRSWVTADRAFLDAPLYQAVSAWLETSWPFERVAYR
ncbi:N-acetyltransferase [Phyllobacterium endophyticum]|uniref:Twin-arginine translocation pathway signal protein n=1 Tax=Phyllobacterium endophyticum TaxID=1149773 RepID=A0A2P7AX91_9HYPH|nr:twin-arginine translocation pathway signal protein [Phyllobacterium endophyticum]TYR39437.1 N-acetyltransferase [Phyllobacterium endophyticum]